MEQESINAILIVASIIGLSIVIVGAVAIIGSYINKKSAK